MRRNGIHVLAAVAAAVALSVAGCGGDVSPGTAAAVPTSSGSSAAGPETVPRTGPSSAAPFSAAPAESAPATQVAPASPAPEPEPASSGECKAAELSLSMGQGDAAAGTVYRPLRFTNTGGRTCVIQGFPGVSYVAGDDGHQVGPAAFRVGGKGPVVSLAPGATANAPVGFTQVRNFDPGVCRPTAVRGLRVYPPHDTAAMFLPMDGTGCAGNPPDNQLVVRTVEGGQGA